MKHIKLFESNEIKDIIEDYLLELIDSGWEFYGFEEAYIDDDWNHFTKWSKKDHIPSSHIYFSSKPPNNGFWICLKPSIGINITDVGLKDQSISDITIRFDKWIEWLNIIPSVMRKLNTHIGETRITSSYSDRSNWLVFVVKKQKI